MDEIKEKKNIENTDDIIKVHKIVLTTGQLTCKIKNGKITSKFGFPSRWKHFFPFNRRNFQFFMTKLVFKSLPLHVIDLIDWLFYQSPRNTHNNGEYMLCICPNFYPILKLVYQIYLVILVKYLHRIGSFYLAGSHDFIESVARL